MRDGAGHGIEPVLDQLGQKLAEAFLPQPVRMRLQAEIDLAVQRNASPRAVAGGRPTTLADLPWEGSVRPLRAGRSRCIPGSTSIGTWR